VPFYLQIKDEFAKLMKILGVEGKAFPFKSVPAFYELRETDS
jgi:hypothetical protein